MKKAIIYLLPAILASCSSDIDFSDPDNKTDAIQFAVGSVYMPSAADVSTRATEHNHIAWNADEHANTLGVFDMGEAVFSNQKMTWNNGKWEYEPLKYWTEESLDFIGYMVEDADLPDATLTKDGDRYTLSFNASIEHPILASPDNTPLICHAPTRSSNKATEVSLQMDQTLTGYSLQFQLGEKMDALRYFVIKSVKVSGVALPKAGTVSRTYTLADGAWTAGNVTWNVTETEDFALSLAAEETKVDTYTEWISSTGGTFYAIPHVSFTPTIEVTYDVYSDASTRTRKDVTSTIVLNLTNFNDLTTGTTGEIHPIRIKIVPDYLYVLSDDDQATGFLVVGN